MKKGGKLGVFFVLKFKRRNVLNKRLWNLYVNFVEKGKKRNGVVDGKRRDCCSIRNVEVGNREEVYISSVLSKYKRRGFLVIIEIDKVDYLGKYEGRWVDGGVGFVENLLWYFLFF